MQSDFSTAGGDRQLIDMVGSRFELIARLGKNDHDTVLFRTCMAAGKNVPLHSHIDPECFYILSGRIEIFVVDEMPCWRVLEAGNSYLIADGVKHAVRNKADEPVDLILVTNNRLARYFSEAGRPAPPGQGFLPPGPEDIKRIVRVSDAYGYWSASPEESAAITG